MKRATKQFNSENMKQIDKIADFPKTDTEWLVTYAAFKVKKELINSLSCYLGFNLYICRNKYECENASDYYLFI